MLLVMPTARATLAGSVDPTIDAMVNLMPDFTAGQALHNLYVNKAMSALPGRYSQMIGSGPTFLSIFYPGWSPDSLLGAVGTDTGLNDDWWREFSVALLCQTFAAVGSRLLKQLKVGDINRDVTAWNDVLRGRSARLYARVLAERYTPFADLLKKVDRAAAKPRFRQALIDNIINRQLWYASGLWTSPDWEIFNQYAKYIALGASDQEVDALADDLERGGLPMPAEVKRATWRSYAEEFRLKPRVDSDDLRAMATPGILKTTYSPSPHGMSAGLPEGNCYEFTANSQPGSRYRESPSSCCFTGDTQVLDDQLRPVPLSRVRPGDRVATRDGVGTVAFVARPLRDGRPLHRLGQDGPTFTATHPFLNAAATAADGQQPALLALAPQQLGWMVPTLASGGVALLDDKALVYRRAPHAAAQAVAPPPAIIRDDAPDEANLYDLNLVTDTGGAQSYWAGSGDSFYLVAPEFPIIDAAAQWAPAVVSLMEGLNRRGLPQARSADWLRRLTATLQTYGLAVFQGGLVAALASNVPTPPTEPLESRVNRLFEAMAHKDLAENAGFAILFDAFLATTAPWIASSVALGWRDFSALSGDLLAVTVFDMSLSPETPLPPDRLVKLDVRFGADAPVAEMWDRPGRANTRFHHYFDQLLHYDLLQSGGPEELLFSASVDGAPIPSLFARVPISLRDAPYGFRSAPLLDASGRLIGTLNFDYRRLSPQIAGREMAARALWTNDAATAFANGLGAAMVDRVLELLDTLLALKEPA